LALKLISGFPPLLKLKWSTI